MKRLNRIMLLFQVNNAKFMLLYFSRFSLMAVDDKRLEDLYHHCGESMYDEFYQAYIADPVIGEFERVLVKVSLIFIKL